MKITRLSWHSRRFTPDAMVAWPLLLIAYLLVAGCAISSAPNKLSTDAQAKFGKIGVVSARFEPQATITQPRNAAAGEIIQGSLAGAALGGATGAAVGCLVGFGCGLFALACCPVFAMFGLGGGAAVGGVTGGTATYLAAKADRIAVIRTANTLVVNEVEAAAQMLVSECELQASVRNGIVSAGQAYSPNAFLLVNDIGPKSFGEEVSYRHLGGTGIDTVLELTVETVGWTGKDFESDSPPVALFMTVRARLLDASDDKRLVAHVHHYEGEKRAYREWNRQLFRKEVEHAANSVANSIVDWISLVAAPAEKPGSRTDD